MLTYKAMYKFCDDGVHAEVLDFPGAISCGKDLDDARANLKSALEDMAKCFFERGEPLPQPDSVACSDEGDVHEPIDLVVSNIVDVYAPSGIDISLLKRNLSVTERLVQNEQALEFVEALQEAGRAQRSRAGDTTRR